VFDGVFYWLSDNGMNESTVSTKCPPDLAPSENTWLLSGRIGELHLPTLSGRVDIARPQLGLHEIEWSRRTLPGQLFCVSRGTEPQRNIILSPDNDPSWPLEISDAYVRGNDLVANYEPSTDWPFSPQVYWQAVALQQIDGVSSALSLLVSVQTHLLNTWPKIVVGSELLCDEVLHLRAGSTGHAQAERLTIGATIQPATVPCCILRRLADAPVSLIEVMPASDFREVSCSQEGDGWYRVQWELFAEFLEKGVIRRATLYCAWLNRENDLPIAAACCDAMTRGPLPLTT
jgi:hypothetical protein